MNNSLNWEKEQKRTRRALMPAIYTKILNMRMLGYPYNKIAEQTSYSESWLRQLFSKGGILYDYYSNFVKETRDSNTREALDIMFAHLPDVIKRLVMNAKNGSDPSAVSSAKIILSYTLGLPKDFKQEESDSATSLADLVKQETLMRRRAEQEEAEAEADKLKNIYFD